MNIYLDIDGVILGTKSPKRDIVRLLKYILKHYSDSTYWLTTHCKDGVNRCAEWLGQNDLPEDLVLKLEQTVKATDWEMLKTEAIDFNQPFVWFDDAPFESERLVLEKNGVSDGCFIMDKRNPKMAKIALKHLKDVKRRKNDGL